MATAEQLKSLISSYADKNSERFYTIALQVAAHEASQGHGAIATEIRNIIDRSKQLARTTVIPFPPDLKHLIITESPDVSKSTLVVPPDLLMRIDCIISEFRQRSKIKAHGLSHRRKLLLLGLPGTGKTMTAKVLAYELKIPLHIVQVDRLVTKFMGETSAKLRQIFDLMQTETAVFLFDEFDALGGGRNLENDVGEMRRVLGAFLQFIEQDKSDCIIVAATNSPQLLDQALFRRFDDILRYTNPGEKERLVLLRNKLAHFIPKKFPLAKPSKESEELSHAEISAACDDSIKKAILLDQQYVAPEQLLKSLRERRHTIR